MIILASTSPRRRELLAQLTDSFRIESPDIDETPQHNESPQQLCKRLALCKAETVRARVDARDIVIAGDTLVACGDELFGKPDDRAHAAQMLRALSGKSHSVHSALAVISATASIVHNDETRITFAALTEPQIARYCATDEPLDKAGGYAIQGGGAAFITRIDGDYSAAIGLSLTAARRLLIEAGWSGE